MLVPNSYSLEEFYLLILFPLIALLPLVNLSCQRWLVDSKLLIIAIYSSDAQSEQI